MHIKGLTVTYTRVDFRLSFKSDSRTLPFISTKSPKTRLALAVLAISSSTIYTAREKAEFMNNFAVFDGWLTVCFPDSGWYTNPVSLGGRSCHALVKLDP